MKSGSSLPRVELEEMGPSLDFIMRRTHLASAEFYKKACRKPKAVKVSVWECSEQWTKLWLPLCCTPSLLHSSSFQVKKVKNVSFDTFGSKLGRVHMKRQDFEKFQTRKVKGLKRSKGHNSEGVPGAKQVKLGTQ